MSHKKGVPLLSIVILVGLMIGSVFFGGVSVQAADGSGTNVVSPTSTDANSTGNTFTFTFTAAEAMDSGGINIAIPSGFSAPQGTAGVSGYTTVSTAGTIADVEDDANSVAGWNQTGGACGNVAPVISGITFHEGAASISCPNGNVGTGDRWYKNISSENWSNYTQVGFWIRSSNSLANNTLQFSYDNSASLASPLESINIGAVAANTWTYVNLNFGATTRTAILSYGLRVNSGNGVDNRTVYVDDILLGPGSLAFSSNSIDARFLRLSSANTVVIVYGDGGGASGITAPATNGIYTATTTSRFNDSGALSNIASHPTITVRNPVPVLTSISPTSTEVGSGTTTITLTGSNFIASSVARWNGSNRTTTFLSSTQLLMTVPPSDLMTAGTSTITVFNPTPGGGTSSGQSFVVRNRVPVVTSLSPNEAFIGDATTTVTITGQYFVSGATANWNGGARTTAFVNSTTLNMTVTTADLAIAGTSTVTITNPTPGGGTSTTSAAFVTKYRTPTITSNTPDPVYVNEISILTITGTNFYSTSVIKFAGTTLNSTTTGSTVITATLPAAIASTTGVFSLTVTNPTPGGGTSATTTNVHYRAPTLDSIMPSTAIAGASGAIVTVTGTGFAGATAINWNGSARTTVFASSTQVSVFFTTSDFSEATTSLITATNPTPGGGASNALTFTVLNPSPTTSFISPTNTFVGDATTTLTVVGTGFNTQSVVRLNGSNRTTTFVSATSVQATLPPSDMETATDTALITVFNPTPGGGTSNAQTFSVNKANITITLTSSLNPSTYGDTVTFTATTTATAGTPTGTVTFKDGGVAIATSTLSSGVATFATSSLIVGAHSITATYNGDINFNASTSVAVSQVVNKANITITLSSSLNPSTYGDTVTFTATTTGGVGAPTGTVTFKDGGVTFATSTLTSGVATAATSTLSAATHSIAATYNGDSNYSASTSVTLSQIVNNPVPVIISLSPDNAEEGSATTSLIISGSAFVPSVSVTFAGTSLSIDSSSSSTISTSIPASLLATFGTSTVAVANPAPGGGTATSSFIITRSAVRFVILDPTDGTVDNPITVTVVAQKENGATSTNYQSDVTLNTSGSATGGGLINIINGVGTATISDTVAETVTLSLTDSQTTGLDVSSTQQVVFAHGATAKFTLAGPATLDAGNRAAFTTTRRDQFNNPATTGPNTTAYFYTTSTSTSAKFYDAATGGSIVTSALISSGTSTATIWYYDEEPGAYTITASDNATSSDGNVGIDDATSTITVRAVATRFVIIDPTDGTVDTPITVTVQAQDNLGHIDTNYQSDVTLFASSTSGQATTTNSGLVNIINGVGTISLSDTVAETVVLSLSDTQSTGLNVASSTQSVVFTPGAVAKFALGPVTDTPQDTRLQLTVFRRDQYDNNVIASSTTAYLYASPTSTSNDFFDVSTGGTQANVLTITNGFASSSIWYGGNPLAALGTFTLTVSDNATSSDGNIGIDDAATSTTITPVATRLVILDPTDGTVDAPITVNVEARDDNNNVVTSYNSSATLAVNGNAVLASAGAITFADGRATTTLTDTVAPETVTISIVASSTTLVATSTQSVLIGVGALSQFTLTDPGNVSAGTLAEYTATRKDQYGNLITSGSVLPSLLVSPTTTPGIFYASNSTSSSQVSSLTFSSGESAKQFWYYNETAGTYQLTVQSGNVVGNDSITINPAAVAKFTMNDRVTTNPGGRLQYTIARKDAFNNPVTSGSLTAYMYASATSTDTAFYDAATNGNVVSNITINDTQSSANVWYYETQTGTYTITASDNASTPDGAAGLLDATDSVSVQTATATRFVFASVTPASIVAGNSSVVTIEARDDFGNLDTNYQTDVTLVTGVSSVSGTGLSSGQAVIDIVNGIGSITLTDNIAEVVNLALSDSQSTGLNVSAVSSITWTPGVTSQFVINDPGDIVARNRIGYTVSRKDQYGNYVTAGSDTIYLHSDSLSSNKAFYTSSTTTSTAQFITITASATSTQFWYYDDTAGTYTITASDNATTPDGTTNIDDGTDQLVISAAPIVATRYVILDPQDVAAGQSTVITIQTQDNAGALDNTQQEDIYLVFSTSSISAVGMANNEVLISIINGVGTVIVTDTVIETVSLSLRKIGGSTSTLAITSTQNVAFFAAAAATNVAGGGVFSYVPPQPIATFTGRAYPGAKIVLFARTTEGDIPLERDIEVRTDGTFTIDFTGALRGLEAFGLSILDANGRVAQTKIYAMNKVTAVTAEKNLYIAPTAGVVQRTVTIGNNVGIAGFAAPGSAIEAEVDGKPVDAQAQVGKDGTYRLLINTKDLAYGGHVVRAKQIDKNGVESDWSPLKVFNVSRALVTRADLNNNGGIDIGDWSIFLTKFGSSNPEVRRDVDINSDGKVDISDFSIFIRSTVNR